MLSETMLSWLARHALATRSPPAASGFAAKELRQARRVTRSIYSSLSEKFFF
jgi:hypothetical protein